MIRVLPFLICTLLVGSASCLASISTLPALIWSSGNYLQSNDRETGFHALYQVSAGSELAAELLGASASGKGASSQFFNFSALQPNYGRLVSVIVLGKLTRTDLSLSKDAASTASLIESLRNAASSVYVSDLESTHDQLVENFISRSQSVLEIGDCQSGGEKVGAEGLHSVLDGQSGKVSVLVCSAEAQGLLQQIEETLRSAARPYIVLYAGQPEQAQGSSRPVARSLISTSASSNEQDLCDRKCRIQVALFEVIILLILLLVALYLGLFMLHILDTPTRFEQEKKDTNRHHND